MSRVYSAITGSARSIAPEGDASEDGDWDVEPSDETPFVEIGGPGGPVFSGASVAPAVKPVLIAPKPAPVTAPKPVPEVKPEPRPEPMAEAARAFPRLAPTPVVAAAHAAASPTAYLSVRFHDLAARTPRHVVGGPDAALVALHFPDHPVSGEYRTLRDEIRRQLPEATSHTLMFASAASEAGTTTVLLNLAVTLAHGGKSRVLVVDANVERPAVASKLALKSAPGLCEVLAQRVPLAWAVQPSVVPALQVLAAGDATDATPSDVCRDFPRLIGQLRQWYDWVLVDAGVWGMMAERDAACPAADAVYLVARDGDAEKPMFGTLRGWVKELGGLLRGYVATKS